RHAGFLDSRMWDTQFELFSENYRVIRYDVRGFGRSDIARTKFSDFKDLRGILDHLRVKTASLIGVSNGGRIASDFAVEYPSMVRPSSTGFSRNERLQVLRSGRGEAVGRV